MKKKSNLAIILLLISCFISTFTYAQRPAKVVSIVKESHDFAYYKSLAQQWKKLIDNNPSDADAWFNYYYANRYARMFKQEYKNSSESYFQDATTIIANAEKVIPATYELYFLKCSEQSPEEMVKDNSVLKAYELGPDRQEIFSLMTNYYEILGKADGKKEICTKWFNSNTMSPALLNYNYNVLQSLDDNAILLTNGDNDTYPIWLLQEKLGIKKGVIVMNIYLISSLPNYRDRIFKELNIPAMENAVKGAEKNNTSDDIYQKTLQHILKNAKQAVYLANTFDSEYYGKMDVEKDLYLVGLAMKYSKSGIDNMALLRYHFENDFLLDYLKTSFLNDVSAKVVSYMNLGYEPMLLNLFEHYQLSGDTNKAENCKKLGLKIARDAGMEEEYRPKFKGN